MVSPQIGTIYKEGVKRLSGKNAQWSNIEAAKGAAQIVKSTLGPFGMDKMLITESKEVIITNDGAEILKNMAIFHPASKILVEVAKAQDLEVGDGTTSAVVLTGALLEAAGKLMKEGIHQNIIIEGYKKASEFAQRVLNEIAVKADLENDEILAKVALTAIGGKHTAIANKDFIKVAIDSVKQISEKTCDKVKADVGNIRIVKIPGKDLSKIEMVKGIVIEGEVDVPDMPERIEGAKIALLRNAIDLDRGATAFAPRFEIDGLGKRREFVNGERQVMTEMVRKVVASGANVLLCEKAIDMYAVNHLMRERILTVRRIDSKDMEQIAKATSGKVVSHANELNSNVLGKAGVVEEVEFGDNKYIYIRDCPSPKSVTIVLRGGNKNILDEAERSLHDALCAIRNTIEDSRIVVGGGACESEIAGRIRSYALTFKGKEQLAVSAYANGLEAIPYAISENAGYDPIDIVVELRRQHEKFGNQYHGINAFSGKVEDMMRMNVLEPLRSKTQMIKSSFEAVSMILKIDDIFESKPLEVKEEGLEDRLKQRETLRERAKRKWSMSPVEVVK